MKEKLPFIHTANVKAFIATAKSLMRREAGLPGLGLVHGQRGLGKTKTGRWYEENNDDVAYILPDDWGFEWMLAALCVALGLSIPRGKRAKHDEVANALIERPRLIIIDEANGVRDRVLESLRILSERTDTPVLFMGHEGIFRKLVRLGPLFDRLLYITEFKPLGAVDLQAFGEKWFELPFSHEAIQRILRSKAGGRVRPSLVAMKRMTDRAKNSRADRVGPEHFKAKDIEAAVISAEKLQRVA